MAAPVQISSHPVIQHKLARLRAVETKSPEFRELVAAISHALFYETTLDLKLKLSRPASELQEVHGSPDQSFWFIVIFDDDDAECGAVNVAMLAPGGTA